MKEHLPAVRDELLVRGITPRTAARDSMKVVADRWNQDPNKDVYNQRAKKLNTSWVVPTSHKKKKNKVKVRPNNAGIGNSSSALTPNTPTPVLFGPPNRSALPFPQAPPVDLGKITVLKPKKNLDFTGELTKQQKAIKKRLRKTRKKLKTALNELRSLSNSLDGMAETLQKSTRKTELRDRDFYQKQFEEEQRKAEEFALQRYTIFHYNRIQDAIFKNEGKMHDVDELKRRVKKILKEEFRTLPCEERQSYMKQLRATRKSREETARRAQAATTGSEEEPSDSEVLSDTEEADGEVHRNTEEDGLSDFVKWDKDELEKYPGVFELMDAVDDDIF